VIFVGVATMQIWVATMRLSLQSSMEFKLNLKIIYKMCRYMFQDRDAKTIYLISQFWFEISFILLWKLV